MSMGITFAISFTSYGHTIVDML